MNLRNALALSAVLFCGTAFASHPLPVILLKQEAPLGTSVPPGGLVTGTIHITATSDGSTNGGILHVMEIEIRPVSSPFLNTPTHTGGTISNKQPVDTEYPFTAISGLTPDTYKWQAREVVDGSAGTWVQFNGGQAAFTVSGVNVLPATTNLGVVRVGQTSAPVTVEVENGTQGPVTLTSASINPGSTFTIVNGPTFPVTFNPGAKIAFQVTGTPTLPGVATGTFSVVSDQPNSPHTGTVTVTGGMPALSLGQSSLDLGEVGINGAGLTKTATLQNPGNWDLVISGATVTGPFTVSGLTNVTVPPGQTHSFQIGFAPTALGPHTGTLTINSDAPGSPHTMSLSGTGTDPLLTVDQSSLSFPDTEINTSSAPLTVQISNPGIGNLNIGAPTVTGPFTTSLTPRTVAEGASTSFTVTFSPTTPGPHTGTLTIPSNDAASPKVISLSGFAPAAGIAATPASHDFGSIALGVSQTTTFTLSNPGDTALNVTSLVSAGTNSAEFTVMGAPPVPFSIPAGGSIQFSVTFAPTHVGIRSASLQVQSNAYPTGTFSVPLQGTGEGPKLSLSTTSLNFGFLNLGATSVRTFDVGNSGTLPLTVNGLIFNTGAAVDYSTSQTVPFTIQPGATTTVTVTFSPTAMGARNSILTVASDDGLQPGAEVTLSGTGRAPDISVMPNSLDFGVVRVGQTSLLNVSVQNIGSGGLNLSSATITGGDEDQFTVAPLGSGTSLAPNAPPRFIAVTYRPTIIGAASSTLVIASDDPDTPTVIIPLKGESIAPGLSLSSTSLNFGGQLVGRTSTPRTFTLTNTGTAPLQAGPISITGTSRSSFAVSAPIGVFVVPAGGSREISVVSTPGTMGEHTATLEIPTDVPGAPAANVELIALGLSEVLSVSQTTLDFGAVRVGAAATTRTFTIQNAGSDPIEMHGFEFVGQSASSFSADLSGTTVPAQGSIPVTVSFTPKSAGNVTGEMVLTTEDTSIPSMRINLSATVVSQLLAVEPGTLSFGGVDLGASKEQTFTLTNKTDFPVTVGAFTSTGSEFTVLTSVPLTIEASGTAQVTVAFAPTKAGAVNGGIGVVLEGGDPLAPEVAIGVSGTGVETGGCSSTGAAAAIWALLALAGPAMLRRRRS